MTVRDIRTAAGIIGRRNALRYLAIGVGASLLAACTGKDRQAATGATSGAPAPSGASASPTSGASPTSAAPAQPSATAATPTKRGVLDRSFEAFVKGAWTIESTVPGGDVARGKATVDLHSWTIEWGGKAGTWQGGYRLHGSGVLAIEAHEGPAALTRERGTQAHAVPLTVGDRVELTLPWQPPGHRNAGDGQRLSVTYADNKLTVRHIEASGSTTTHVCTRA
ncbi:hypothetical protein [Streptomyces sp. NBC_01294]|uniref:hypothetical protein n=1 Tax=Streptomyces sp. NBC_01294 TaxID=2903815 RepID=UPI002DD89ED6|nr:hypothetical protein [Streptomyces sp. NBC_01294]WRZ55408.1 hypothetical protein OG534_02235 [Streptomyces sp. NBC_01294]WRZ61288.1 hypothetical protein OG534_35265 [Streptomyces sp. NBC_01294]